MKKSSLLIIVCILASSVLLTGCSKQTTPETSDSPVIDTVTNDVILDETTSTVLETPESVSPTLSNSTETEDLQKELDATTIDEEDFSDLQM